MYNLQYVVHRKKCKFFIFWPLVVRSQSQLRNEKNSLAPRVSRSDFVLKISEVNVYFFF